MLMRVGGESAAKPSAVSPAVSHPVHPPHPASVSHPVHPAASSGKSSAYTVHSGDTLSGIASRNHLSLSALEKDNPQIKNPNLILPGQVLHLGSGVNSASSPGPSHLTRSAPFISPAANSPAIQPIPNASPNQPIPAELIVYNLARPTTGVMV